jgi:hypothetical protein
MTRALISFVGKENMPNRGLSEVVLVLIYQVTPTIGTVPQYCHNIVTPLWSQLDVTLETSQIHLLQKIQVTPCSRQCTTTIASHAHAPKHLYYQAPML